MPVPKLSKNIPATSKKVLMDKVLIKRSLKSNGMNGLRNGKMKCRSMTF